ncbi:NmrA family transcriptional regulator [Reticulibacter mediterranei]|uniref:NmrA family transcriptional regulator n=1 Tax=Reticulibacter mediterranei TaxID=2778369 RepID=A0A8J3IFR7_9CHLR|nr:NmrA family NAD(P)-binding protein [Reticulibacter mediterranei]GHO90364.1 NmrA family transcriptional regulator [Reticulibacter mediterranei]
MRIVINTPSGNVGRLVTDQLLQTKEEVVIISRHPEKVANLVAHGASLMEGSIDDPSVLDRALNGADTLYWATPTIPHPDYHNWSARAAQTAAEAVKRHEVKRVVVLSTWGAQHGPGAGPVGVHLAIETAFQAAAPHVTILRAAIFMEDFVTIPSALNHIGMIAAQGTIFGPFDPAKKVPIVAARDVGEKVVEALLDTRWSGFRITGIHGPEDLDFSSMARIIGEGIGRPVKYVQMPLDQVKQGLLDAGMPGSFVEYIMEMYTEQAAGRADPAEPRSTETTTRTSLLEFSREVIKPAVEVASMRMNEAV